MEAWKFIDFSNNQTVSPAYALSLTAERWGLEGFPGNLVAFPSHLDHIVPLNSTTFEIEAWTLPYDCSSTSIQNRAAVHDPSYLHRKEEQIVANFCSEPCAASGCLILIEGIGKTRKGPLHSSIVGLAHGISFLLALSLSIAITMCLFLRNKRPKASPMPQIGGNASYVRPVPSLRLYAEGSQRKARSAKEIVECADLLREMYSMDLQIWGLQHARDPRKREEYMYKANALFVEICRIVQVWRESDGRWSREEWRQIEEMANFLDQHGRKRYSV